MIPDQLKSRLRRNRPMTTITLHLPEDVIDSLSAIAPHRGLSDYHALLKAYISQGLRQDEAVHMFGPAARLADALRRRGVPSSLIEEAAREAAAE